MVLFYPLFCQRLDRERKRERGSILCESVCLCVREGGRKREMFLSQVTKKKSLKSLKKCVQENVKTRQKA